MGKSQFSKVEKKYGKPVVYLMTGGLEYLVDKAGGVCQGMTVRVGDGDALLIIRAEFEGRAMVSFVGSATAAGAMVRLHKDLRNGGLKWRADKYAKQE